MKKCPCDKSIDRDKHNRLAKGPVHLNCLGEEVRDNGLAALAAMIPSVTKTIAKENCDVDVDTGFDFNFGPLVEINFDDDKDGETNNSYLRKVGIVGERQKLLDNWDKSVMEDLLFDMESGEGRC